MPNPQWNKMPIGLRLALLSRPGILQALNAPSRTLKRPEGFAPTLANLFEQRRERRLQRLKTRVRVFGGLLDTLTQPVATPANVYDVVDATSDTTDDGTTLVALPAPTVTTPAAPVSVNLANYSITGTAPANTTVDIYPASGGVALPGALSVGTETLAGAATTFSITVLLTPNAVNQFVVMAVDAMGNQSPSTTVPTITQGTTIAAPLVSDPLNPVSTTVGSYQIQGTAAPNALVQVFQAPGGVKGAAVGALQLSGGATSYAITVTLAAGLNQYQVTATDGSGSESSPTNVPTITQGTTLAAPTVSNPLAAVATNAGSYQIQGTSAPNSLVQVFQTTGGIKGPAVGAAKLSAGSTSYTITVALNAGVNAFLVTATDGSGTESPPASVPAITQGAVLGVPTVIIPAAAVSTNVGSYQIQGTAAPNALVQVFQAPGGVKGAAVGALQLSGGATSYAITVTLAAGPNLFVVTARDSAGNESAPVTVPQITQGAVLASPTISTPSAPVTVSIPTYSITGVAPANTTVEVFQASGGVQGARVGFETLVGSATSYSINVPLTLNVANQFMVTATDSMGNRSAPTTVPIITQSAPMPAPTVANPASAVTSNASSYQIQGTAPANSLVQVFQAPGGVRGAAVGAAQLSGGNTSYTITVPLNPGSNQFIVTARDSTSNESTPTNVPVITQGQMLPTPTVTTPPSPVTVSFSTYSITGTAAPNTTVEIFPGSNGAKVPGAQRVGYEVLAGSATTYSINVPLTPNTTNQFVVTSSDGTNESPTASVPTITQALPPSAPAVLVPGGPVTVNSNSYQIQGTAPANSLVQVFQAPGGVRGAAVGAAQLSGGNTSYSITVPLNPGSNQFIVTARDSTSNESTPTNVPMITLGTPALASTPSIPAEPVVEIEGIGKKYARMLEDAGIRTTADLLTRGATPSGRTQIAQATGIDGSKILTWVNNADLFRIDGVDQEYADLLVQAGVNTILELKHRNAQSLRDALASANKKHRPPLVKRLPSLNTVKSWIAQANTLEGIVTY